MKIVKRSFSLKIDELLSFFPVVIVLGVRQCGKTTLVKNVRPGWKYFDLEKGNDFDRIIGDLDFFFKQHPDSNIIDEAQRCPELFQGLMSVIGPKRNVKNRFLRSGLR